MKTITTKILPATNFKGTRISVTDGDNRIVVSGHIADDIEEAQILAAKTLRDKLGWKTEMIGGHTKDGMVFVMLHKSSPTVKL